MNNTIINLKKKTEFLHFLTLLIFQRPMWGGKYYLSIPCIFFYQYNLFVDLAVRLQIKLFCNCEFGAYLLSM